MKSRIINIQRYSLHDGPGIRTTVFFKGCSLRCEWCCNPESQEEEETLYFDRIHCIGCRSCEKSCLKEAISFKSERIAIDFDKCQVCSEKECVAVCPSTALTVFGKKMTVDEVLETVKRDEIFYVNSGGGVTASGGEPLLNFEFIKELFNQCKERGYNTAIESSLHVPWNNIDQVIPFTDLFLCDFKHVEPEIFNKWTKGKLSIIMKNLRLLIEKNVSILVRIPLIPGFNADEASLFKMCSCLSNLGIKQVSFLPYHRLGEVKYENLSLDYKMKGIPLLTKKQFDLLKVIPNRFGIELIV
jgi:pyruvate formate lyase activating enzyme